MIAVIDYGMGNLRSVQKALQRVGADAVITDQKSTIEKANKIVLPGVGAMAPAMEKLSKLDLVETICESIHSNIPFLGICLGLQLLFEQSDEGGNVKGLGIIQGDVKQFKQLKVPHMGWNQLKHSTSDCPLFKDIEEGSETYFCHSFYVAPTDPAVTATQTDYGIEFTSSVWKDQLFGVQFHPEKSQKVGLKILKNFVRL